mmetsp:Transcript_146505/g.365348  ORF Transcript_146505/g.365348 Transcript_146505/m.365348 type:complete len:290 (+) Transcript_146505:223-1092(+)
MCKQQLTSFIMTLRGCIQQWCVVRPGVVGNHGLHRGAGIQQQRQDHRSTSCSCDVHGCASVGNAPGLVVRSGMHVSRALQHEAHDGLWSVLTLGLQPHCHVYSKVYEATSQQLLGTLVEPSLWQWMVIHVIDIAAARGIRDATKKLFTPQCYRWFGRPPKDQHAFDALLEDCRPDAAGLGYARGYGTALPGGRGLRGLRHKLVGLVFMCNQGAWLGGRQPHTGCNDVVARTPAEVGLCGVCPCFDQQVGNAIEAFLRCQVQWCKVGSHVEHRSRLRGCPMLQKQCDKLY